MQDFVGRWLAAAVKLKIENGKLKMKLAVFATQRGRLLLIHRGRRNIDRDRAKKLVFTSASERGIIML